MGIATMMAIVLGALALCVLGGYAFIQSYLSSPHTYGEVKVTPYGHDNEGLLKHTWDSLFVETPAGTFTVVGADIDLTVLGDGKKLELKLASLKANIKGNSQKTGKDAPLDLNALKFPEDIKAPIPISLDVKEAKVTVQGKSKDEEPMKWEAKDISIKTDGPEQIHVKADKINGNFVAAPTKVDIKADFSSSNLKVNGYVKAGADSVGIAASAPKKSLASVKTSVQMDVQDPAQWMPFTWPAKAPALGKTSITAEASFNKKTKKPHFHAVVTTRMGERWPLPPTTATVTLDGDEENVETDILVTTDEGGEVHLTGPFNIPNVEGDWSGTVKRMSAEFGPQMMPMDANIRQAHLKDGEIYCDVETPQGSFVDGTISFKDHFEINYHGDISPYEPWAIDWTKGNMIFSSRPQLYGNVNMERMHVLAKFDTIPFVYNMTVDSMQVELDLDLSGIDFSNGIIYTPKETFDFTGDVKWDEHNAPHTSWKVHQRHGGTGEVYITIMDSLTIEAKADSVEISTIPFAKLKLNEKLSGRVSGFWHQNFETNVGSAELTGTAEFQPFTIQGELKAHQNKDTIFVEKLDAVQSKNHVESEAIFILPNDSNPEFKPTGPLPIQVVHAWISAKDFNIPLLLEPINDSTLTSGMINGDIAYNENRGLQGNIDFNDIQFTRIPSRILNIKRMNLFAEASKVEVNSYLEIGGGGWSGNTQVILDNIFEKERHVSFTHNTDNGGNIWADGFIDSSFVYRGLFNVNGTWFIPGTSSEIKKTDLQINVAADIREGIKGITADLSSNNTLYQLPKLTTTLPFIMKGHLEKGIFNMTEFSTTNDSGEVVSATLEYDLDQFKLTAIDFHSDHYSLRSGEHTVAVDNLDGHLEEGDDELVITANLPLITYNFNHETFGDALALGHSDMHLSIPKSQEGVIKNMSLNGNLVIDKMVYYKELDIEITPNSIDKLLTMFNNFITKLRKKEQVEAKISSASPIDLSFHISDSQEDSVAIVTPFATFPLTVDVWVLGNSNRPLLRGDISNSNGGFIGVQDIYEFDLNAFRISWNDVIWQHGVVDVSSSQDLPYCDDTEEKETCPVNLDIQGTITNLQPTPSSNCGNESSAAAIYYNIFLGCIANDNGETTDWNKLAGKAIGKVLSSTVNKTFGGEYIGDIDMKVMFFNSSSINEKDSSYVKVPISLDRWVKNLSFILGYTQDQSEDPTYEQALQFGVNYKLPVFQEKEFRHPDHLSPELSLNGLLISKQYLTSTGTEGNENRIEKNIGLNYTYKYWNPCLLGIGKCETKSYDEIHGEEPKKEEGVKK